MVTAEMARFIGSAGWLLVAWLFTGFLTVTGALSYGELASMMPRAGGQYVYLREAFSPLWGFLYGWTLFMVIQTGTIAAIGVGFARFLGVLWPPVSEIELHHCADPHIERLCDFAFDRAGGSNSADCFADVDQHARAAIRKDRSEHFHDDENSGAGWVDRGRITARLERERGARQLRRWFLDRARFRSGCGRRHGGDGIRVVRGDLRVANRIAVCFRCVE